MLKRNIGLFIFIICLILAVAAQADELNLEQVVVTATRTPQVMKNVGTNVSVITKEDIAESKMNSLADIVNKAAGVETGKEGTLGSNPSLSIRGCRVEQVLVMIDGRSVNSTSLGLAELSQIPLDNIDRVEIVRGAASSLYGSNALGGVINIITKKGESGVPITDIYFSNGTFNTNSLRLNFGGKKDKFDYMITGGKDASNGWRENSDYENKNFSFAGGYSPGPFRKFNFSIGYYSDELGIPGPSNVNVDQWNGTIERISSSPNARQDTDKTYLSLEYLDKLSVSSQQDSALKIKVYGNDDQQAYVNPDWSINDLRKNITRGVEAQLDTITGITAGGDFHQDGFRQEDRNLRTDKISKKTQSGSLYVEDIINFNTVNLTVGLRYDHHSAYTAQTNPHAGLIWHIFPQLKYSANAGGAFRAPTFNDLYWPTEQETYWGITYVTMGNPDLQPEKAASYDTGLEYDLADILMVKGTLFMTQTSDMIDWKQTMLTVTTYKYQPENYLRGISQGVEFELNHKISSTLTQGLNYTYLNAKGKRDDGDDYKNLKFRPRNRANYKISYNNDFGFGVNFTGEYVDEQWEQDDNQGLKLPAYTLLNIRLTQKIADAELFFGIDNITDKRYIDRTDGFGKTYPLPGRTIFGGITLKLWG
jgi:outer membrane cobalamin receptor